MNELLEMLNEEVKKLNADGVKIYFNDETNYCVKFIKDNKVISHIRKVNSKFNGWDLMPARK